MIRLLDCPSFMHSRGGALNFQFGIGVQPEGPNRGACKWTTADCLGPK